MGKISSGYTSYFNYKYNRSGSLFQGPFKSVHIKSENKLLYLSSYINGNPEIHKISTANKWIWSSYQDYLNLRNGDMCDKEEILKHFKNIKNYQKYTSSVIQDASDIKDDLKIYTLE